MKKLRKHQKIHRMAKNIYELWISRVMNSNYLIINKLILRHLVLGHGWGKLA